MSARGVPAYPCSPKRTTASLRMRTRLSSLPARGRPGPRRLAGAAGGGVGVLTVFMAESWHLPVRELQGGKVFIGIIRSSVTSACPARDVCDNLISVFAQLISSYQHRDLQPRGLCDRRDLHSPPPSHGLLRSSYEDAQKRVAIPFVSRFYNTCGNLVSGSNTGDRSRIVDAPEGTGRRAPAAPRLAQCE